MTHSAYLIIGLMVLFVVGAIMSLRTTPHDRALDRLRQRARTLDLQPRLVAAPSWTGHLNAQGKPGGMLACYSLVVPEANFPLMQAQVQQGRLNVVQGDRRVQDLPWSVTGCEAVEVTGNRVSFYWDEATDLDGAQLESMKQAMQQLASYWQA